MSTAMSSFVMFAPRGGSSAISLFMCVLSGGEWVEVAVEARPVSRVGQLTCEAFSMEPWYGLFRV